MLATQEIVTLVASRLKSLGPVPVVLDPVLAAGGGFPLLDEAGIAAMQDQLFDRPPCSLPTSRRPPGSPGLRSAARLTWKRRPGVSRPRGLAGSWPRAVTCRVNRWTPRWEQLLPPPRGAPWQPRTNTAPALPGQRRGCRSGSRAIPAGGGESGPPPHPAGPQIRPAFGPGSGPVNPYAPFARELARFAVLADLQAAASRLQAEDLSPLIPEVMTNLGFAAPYPEGPQDAAFPGPPGGECWPG